MVLRSPAPTHARTLEPQKTSPRDHAPAANSPVDPRWIAVAGASALSLTAVFTKLADASVPTVVFYRCLLAVVPLALLAWLEDGAQTFPVRCGYADLEAQDGVVSAERFV
ncbi:MAG: hypothetical protein L0H59_10090, partial [Tomitella sp.]|nr:hypothetical protein [Tomitella sp.]